MLKINNSLTHKKDYLSPEIDVFQYLTEVGYALSQFESNDGGEPPLYSNGDPDNPDFYMGGPLGEETL